MASEKTTNTTNLQRYIEDVLKTIEREREREIITRRFGLFDRKETLEQIGELLGITRERVRQLEKVIINRLQSNGNKLPNIPEIQKQFSENLRLNGGAARVSTLTSAVSATNDKLEQSRVAFLAKLCPELFLLEENDFYYSAVGISSINDLDTTKRLITKVNESITSIGNPVDIKVLAKTAEISDYKLAESLASISKQMAALNGRWGLIKWPMVNPKNIRDKIYVILKEQGKQMHFNEIAEAIKKSDFKRKDVTTQAIHNELIKDPRFVLIGRGIYALKEWGYQKGTVADIITKVLKEAGEPLHRDEIVRRVLKSRFVKETTILLNLQGKNQFKRVAKATYDISDAE